jgi:hypothetical protein
MFDLQHFADNIPYGASAENSRGRLVFGRRPGDNIPYRVPAGAVPAVAEHEVGALPIQSDVVAMTFDISKIEDKEEYQRIRNAIYCGWYKELYIERRLILEPLRMIIYIEFAIRERYIKHPLYHNDPRPADFQRRFITL